MTNVCIIGWPIEHSRSPLIHRTWLAHYGLEGNYTREAVKPEHVAEFLAGLEGRGFAGCNVTVPHKEAALKAAQVRHPAAEAVGAANTLWLEDGNLHATNTDTYGFMSYLGEKVPDWSKGAPKIVVFGAGGAARAIIFGLRAAGHTHIFLTNRTMQRALDVRAHFGDGVQVIAWDDRAEAVKDARLIINTTTLGMNDKGSLDIDLTTAHRQCVVSDIVYTPLETGLLRAAKQRGLTTVDGLGMLLHQAVPGFEKWFGLRPIVSDELYALIANDVQRQA